MKRADHDRLIGSLESEIDSAGLAVVLEAIAELCYLKAEHISSKWQDEALSQKWDRAGAKLEKVSAGLKPLGL